MNNLLTCLTEQSILVHLDCSIPSILHKEASNATLGCALFQEQDGAMIVSLFGRRALTIYVKNHLEFLALIRAVCDHFKSVLF